jgi:hypothetical protein
MKRREIIIEIERTRVIYNRASSRDLQWCPFCGAKVEILNLAEAAAALGGKSRETILRLAREGRLHLYQTNSEARVLDSDKESNYPAVCLNSLLSAMD